MEYETIIYCKGCTLTARSMHTNHANLTTLDAAVEYAEQGRVAYGEFAALPRN